jgi:hypothetical protein
MGRRARPRFERNAFTVLVCRCGRVRGNRYADADVNICFLVRKHAIWCALLRTTITSPTSCSPPLRSSNAYFAYSNRRRFQPENVLREDKENLNKIIALKLELKGAR